MRCLELIVIASLAGACGGGDTAAKPEPTPAATPAAITAPLAKPGAPIKPLPPPTPSGPPADPATSLITRGSTTCAVLTSGAVTCWGRDLGAPHQIPGWTDVIRVALPEGEVCALHRDGRVDCVVRGQNPDGSTAPTQPYAIRGVTVGVDLAAAGEALCVLEKSGDVACRVDGRSVTRTRMHHATSLVMGELVGADWQFPDVAYACSMVDHKLECLDVYVQAEQSATDPRTPIDRYLAPVGTKPKLWLGAPHVVFDHLAEVTATDANAICARTTDVLTSCVTLDADLKATPADAVEPRCKHTDTSAACAFTAANPPITVALDHPTRISAGPDYACAIFGGGAVACWGNAEDGKLGRSVEPGPNTLPAWGLDDAIDLVVWTYGAVALRANGQLAYWGHGDAGNRLAIETAVPITFSNITDATRIVAGHFHACVLRRTGAVACWGLSTVGDFAPETPTDVPGLRDVRELAATDFGVMARTADGTLLHVGDPLLGPSAAKTPAPIKTAEHAASVVIAGSWVCVLDHVAGPVRCWNEDSKHTTPELLAVTDAVEIAGSGPQFEETDANAKLVARLGDGRAVEIDLALKDGKPIAATTELAKVTRSLFTSAFVVCARGATGTTCTSADRMEPPAIPRTYDNARAFTAVTPSCALTAAGTIVCFANTDLFTDGTGRGMSTVPVPIAL